MLNPVFFGFIFMAVAIGASFWAARVQQARERQRQESWAAMAEPLGLTYEDGALAGEVEGVPVRLYVERNNIMGQSQHRIVLYVMQAEVPGQLPSGFVAAPRKWTSWSDRVTAPNVFKTGEPAVDEAYIFQSYQTELGPKLLQDAEVLRALADLILPEASGFVQNNRVGLAYKTAPLTEDTDKVRHNVKLLVRAAQALAEAQARHRLAA
ncbi:hypothetical protein [Archangium sp.]|uniref:hypothetical protein n=1 Tax=Archangium sp. TaxID=1872627 RepID=UPI003899E1E4